MEVLGQPFRPSHKREMSRRRTGVPPMTLLLLLILTKLAAQERIKDGI